MPEYVYVEQENGRPPRRFEIGPGVFKPAPEEDRYYVLPGAYQIQCPLPHASSAGYYHSHYIVRDHLDSDRIIATFENKTNADQFVERLRSGGEVSESRRALRYYAGYSTTLHASYAWCVFDRRGSKPYPEIIAAFRTEQGAHGYAKHLNGLD